MLSGQAASVFILMCIASPIAGEKGDTAASCARDTVLLQTKKNHTTSSRQHVSKSKHATSAATSSLQHVTKSEQVAKSKQAASEAESSRQHVTKSEQSKQATGGSLSAAKSKAVPLHPAGKAAPLHPAQKKTKTLPMAAHAHDHLAAGTEKASRAKKGKRPPAQPSHDEILAQEAAALARSSSLAQAHAEASRAWQVADVALGDALDAQDHERALADGDSDNREDPEPLLEPKGGAKKASLDQEGYDKDWVAEWREDPRPRKEKTTVAPPHRNGACKHIPDLLALSVALLALSGFSSASS